VSRLGWILAWAAAVLPIAGFWTYGLFDLDEGIYAASLREMQRNHEWIIPTFGGKPFLEKPILMYWGALAASEVGVPGVAALRLFPAVCFVGLLAVIAAFVRRFYDDKTAAAAMLAAAFCPLVSGVGRLFMPDAPLLLFFTLSLFAFWISLSGSLWWRTVAGCSLGLAMLAKGPFVVVAFAVIAACIWFGCADVRYGMKRGWIAFVIAFVAVVSIWYLPIAIREGPQFFREFVLKQNLARFAGGDEAHPGPFFYYIPVLILALWPWVPSLFCSIRNQKTDLEKMLWAWSGVIFVLFSAAGSKLPHYVAPAIVPLGVLAAAAASKRQAGSGAWQGWVLAALGVSAAASAWLLRAWPVGGWIAFGVWLAGAGGAILAFEPRIRRLTPAIAAGVFWIPLLAAGMPLYWQSTHGDIYRVAMFLKAEHPKAVLEYRMDGMGEPLATSHPSLRWYCDFQPTDIEWPEQIQVLLERGSFVLSRRNRLTPSVLRELRSNGYDLVLVGEDFGEYQLFRCASVP